MRCVIIIITAAIMACDNRRPAWAASSIDLTEGRGCLAWLTYLRGHGAVLYPPPISW